jgi:hypothetical protein
MKEQRKEGKGLNKKCKGETKPEKDNCEKE